MYIFFLHSKDMNYWQQTEGYDISFRKNLE